MTPLPADRCTRLVVHATAVIVPIPAVVVTLAALWPLFRRRAGYLPLALDEVFLSGRESRDRLRSALAGLLVVWVGVHCDLDEAVAREAARPDRTQGMAASQELIVREDVQYDLQVDTTSNTAFECATTIAAHVDR